jgi:hypothetical protein
MASTDGSRTATSRETLQGSGAVVRRLGQAHSAIGIARGHRPSPWGPRAGRRTSDTPVFTPFTLVSLSTRCPRFSSNRTASRWFTGLPSATSTRKNAAGSTRILQRVPQALLAGTSDRVLTFHGRNSQPGVECSFRRVGLCN